MVSIILTCKEADAAEDSYKKRIIKVNEFEFVAEGSKKTRLISKKTGKTYLAKESIICVKKLIDTASMAIIKELLNCVKGK